jgi:hypothetical protein
MRSFALPLCFLLAFACACGARTGLDALAGDPCALGTKLATLIGAAASNEAANASWGPNGMIVYDDAANLLLVPASGGTPQNITASITTGGRVAADPVWASGCAAIP